MVLVVAGECAFNAATRCADRGSIGGNLDLTAPDGGALRYLDGDYAVVCARSKAPAWRHPGSFGGAGDRLSGCRALEACPVAASSFSAPPPFMARTFNASHRRINCRAATSLHGIGTTAELLAQTFARSLSLLMRPASSGPRDRVLYVRQACGTRSPVR